MVGALVAVVTIVHVPTFMYRCFFFLFLDLCGSSHRRSGDAAVAGSSGSSTAPAGVPPSTEGPPRPVPTGSFTAIATVRVISGRLVVGAVAAVRAWDFDERPASSTLLGGLYGEWRVGCFRNLLSMDVGSEQDPYVVLTLSVDGVTASQGRTSVVKSGGQNPVWTFGNVVPLRSVPSRLARGGGGVDPLLCCEWRLPCISSALSGPRDPNAT